MHCAQRAWRGCLRGQLATRSTPRRWPTILCVDNAPGRRLRRRAVVPVFFSPRGARRARASPRGEPANRPQRTHCTLRSWRGCLRGKLATRSAPRRWPRLLCADTAPCWRLRLRTVVSVSSRPVARGARALRHVENQPTAHRALVSARCVLGAVVCAANSRRAPPHVVSRGSWLRHRAMWRLRLRASVVVSFYSRGARRARASPRGEPTSRPQRTHCTLRAWRSCLHAQLS